MNNKPLASRLEGKTLGKWRIIEKRKKTVEDNSGYWSTCYTVENEKGELAFLKAYNYVYAFKYTASSADTLKFMNDNYIYERDLLQFCKEHKMRRIVTAIDSGVHSESNEIIPVPYLVFEIAQGNLKSYQAVNNPALGWKLKSFHDALVGLSQLHRAKIVHQDIKPSNILIFGKNISKISDLGSATQLNNESYWTKDDHCGDMRYAPIELLYNYFSTDWDTRRFGADLFMMGGILTYLITDSNFLSLMCHRIPENQKHFNFGGTYKEAETFIMKAYYETLEEIERLIPKIIRKKLIKIIAELCHPIPELRGNPKRLQITHPRYSLQRYISVMDRLSKTVIWSKYD
ncbi:MAG: protein kinase family protein [Candidatus Cloacimonetes bacterium]|nr:protein kinase family protein [Candidatus Cloacimonadota bacterium]